MPPNKKVNTKVAAANERKAAVQKERDARARERQEADLAEVWSFGANGRQKARAEQNDQKRQQAEAKKAELKRLKEQEEAELSSMRPARGAARKAMMKSGGPKPTRTSFLSPLQPSEDVKENNREAPVPMEPNRNLIDDGFVEVHGIDEALDSLFVSGAKELDRHPERRAKAAYTAFEERMLPILKDENPHLKLSQYKQKLRDLWKKSPENPLNQASLPYNAKPGGNA
ncbi:HMG box domain-containing protein [Plasmodiophora brassicae]